MSASNPQRISRELRKVLVIWAILLAVAIAALLVLNANSLRLINYIETVKVSRYQRTMALYTEAEKHLRALKEKEGALSKSSESHSPISPGDPDFRAAVDFYTRGLALDPRREFDPELAPRYEALGQVFGTAGQQTSQTIAFARASIASGKLEVADSELSRTLAMDRNNAEALALAAQVHLRQGKVDLATRDADSLERATTDAALVHEIRGQVAFAANDGDRTISEFQKSLDANPDKVELWKQLADVLESRSRSADALVALEQGETRGGREDANFMHRLGEKLLSANRAQDAVRALERGVELERNSSSLWWTLAQAYQQNGQTRKSNDCMQEAMRLDPALRNRALNAKP